MDGQPQPGTVFDVANGIRLTVDTDHRLTLHAMIGGSERTLTTDPLTLKTWYKLTAEYQGNTLRLRVNQQPALTATVNGSTTHNNQCGLHNDPNASCKIDYDGKGPLNHAKEKLTKNEIRNTHKSKAKDIIYRTINLYTISDVQPYLDGIYNERHNIITSGKSSIWTNSNPKYKLSKYFGKN